MIEDVLARSGDSGMIAVVELLTLPTVSSPTNTCDISKLRVL